MKTLRQTPKENGFTLAEVMVAAVIMGIVMVMTFAYLTRIYTDLQTTYTKNDQDRDLALAERILWKDLQNIQFSYNTIIQPDDNSKGLFDYYPDLHSSFFSAADLTRTLTLTPGQGSISLITSDNKSLPFMYSPVAAYDVTENLMNVFAGGTYKFNSVNRLGYLSTNAPQLWQPDTLLLFYVPVYMRPRQTNNPADLTKVPRQQVMLGFTESAAPPSKFYITDLSGTANISLPTDPLTKVTTPDIFFVNLPTIGGASSLVFVQKVHALRYFVAAHPTKTGRGQLVRRTWNPKTQGFDPSTDQIVLPDIKDVKFERKSVTSPLIEFTISN